MKKPSLIKIYRSIGLSLFLTFFTASVAIGDTIYVNADATGYEDGTSWDDGYTDLQDALGDTSLSSGDEIWVAAGTYYPGTSRSDYFQMVEGVAIYGGFAGSETDLSERDIETNETILSGDIGTAGTMTDNCYHIFYHPSGTDLTAAAVLSGFTITGAYANGGGNHDNGAGMYNYGSSPTIEGCTFSENYADDTGGGMVNNSSSSPTLEECTFLENTAGGNGGGMNNIASDPVVTNCTFSGNSASTYGGGMFNSGYAETAPDITNCVFSGNSANRGGAIRNESSAPSITNCTFSGNTASGYGGAIYFANSAPVLTNCILWGDTANESSGQDEICNASSTITYHYCDIENSYNSSDAWVTYLGTDGTANIDADPLFVRDPGTNGSDDYGDLHLTYPSPCIDTGGASTEDADMDGEERVFDGDGDETAVVDMGADEWVDTDQDGLSDYEEENVYGTDPDDTDTDNDGLTDYEEVVTYGTDPTDIDTDDDGYNDGAEIIHDSDPADDGSAPTGGLTIYVDADATGSGAGKDWANAFTQLQTALTVALSGDAIWVAEGTYYPISQPTEIDTTDVRYNHFALVEGVAVYGGFDGTETDLDDRDPAANETILSGDIDGDDTLDEDNAYHVFYHPDGTGLTTDTVLSGFTITGGYANGSEPHSYGGGMFNDGSSPTIEGCTFSGNYAGAEAGGMRNVSASAPMLTNCVFTGNETAGKGGALANGDASSPLITNCTFSGNTADQYGGAIVNDSYSNPVLTNCILWGDAANEVYNASSTPTFYYCDVEGSGGSGDDWDSDLGNDGGNNIDDDPKFDSDGIHLLGASPCIDTGNNTATADIEKDIDGETRTVNDTVDMGADEFYDADGDGMSDYAEEIYGADPTTVDTADSDGDGLTDVEEVGTYGTDPDDADMDGDGLSDYEEVITHETDPDDADTDDDGYNDWVEIFHDSDPAVGGSAPTGGLTIYVDADATGSGAGKNWANAFTELQTALTVALSGDAIWVAAGTYYPTSQPTEIDTSNDRYNHFALKEGVWVYGGFDGTEIDLDHRDPAANGTILSGDIGILDENTDNCYHVFYHPSGTDLTPATVLSGFTITEGYANGDSTYNSGGGMFNASSSPTITNCTFLGNYALSAGGMYNKSSHPTLTDCTFSDNWAENDGGGMFNDESSPTLKNCTFSDNYASSGSGGGMHNCYSSYPTLTDCTFSGNQADNDGGGMYNYYFSYPTLKNCTFSGNQADNDGGGMFNWENSSPALTNCTFSGNYASQFGGGMANVSGTGPTLTNCILWGDTDGDDTTNSDEVYNALSTPPFTIVILRTVTTATISGMKIWERMAEATSIQILFLSVIRI